MDKLLNLVADIEDKLGVVGPSISVPQREEHDFVITLKKSFENDGYYSRSFVLSDILRHRKEFDVFDVRTGVHDEDDSGVLWFEIRVKE